MPPPCPFLPPLVRVISHQDIHVLGSDRSRRFYDATLDYAQSLWLAGYPAKTLLLVNRALSCSLADVEMNGKVKPYHAVAWIMQNRPADRFIGNPRRHFQHLATRMVEPHRELRIWRAWACWYLAKEILPHDGFPHDAEQVREEHIVKPRRFEIAAQLRALSPCDDAAAWEAALKMVRPTEIQENMTATIRIIREDEVFKVRKLAHEIWPQAYAGIISAAQIEYMLADRYDLRTLQREIAERGVVYALLGIGEEDAGYLAYEEVRNDRSIYLHKLYLKPEHHGCGIGAQALRWLADRARAGHAGLIRLRVNRMNHTAIRAYLREGFRIEQEIITNIGGGFVMDDYVMAKPITSE